MPFPRSVFSDPDAIGCQAILALSFVAWLWIFLPLIPADAASIAHDYSLYLPNTLAGYYWFLRNGPLAVPWFTPAQCGGLPYFADLTTSYFSLPQWLTIVISPIAAVRATFAMFAGLGAIGFYVLMRRRFAATSAAAATAAVLFLFNGLYAYRHAGGLVGVHALALTPWLVLAVLTPRPERASPVEAALAAAWPPVVGGAVVAYMFQAGMTHFLPSIGIAVAVMLLVHGQFHGHRLRAWGFLGAAALVSCALSASRLAAAVAFLEPFPRADYPLPGFPGVGDLLRTVAAAVFWRVSPGDATSMMTNLRWDLGQSEWEYGVGPAALGLLAVGAGAAVARFAGHPRRPSRFARSALAWSVIALALAVPLALNWYEPRWNSFLKSLPVLGSSSTLVRWFALYVPVVALLGGLALHRVAPERWSGIAVAALVAVVTVAWNAAASKSDYIWQGYDGARIEDAWRDARSSGRVPPISEITGSRSASGELQQYLGRNDMLTIGYSQLACYQPIFGYRLENLPVGPMVPGPALKEIAPGVLNVKNPACYLYPRENACVPGDHFRVDQRDDAVRFLSYRPFPFARSSRQHVADGVTLAALCLTIAVVLGYVSLALRRAWLSRASGR